MREKLTEKDNLLIYYAGHGELDEANQRGQWLPVDAEPNNTANWIPITAVTDILNVMSVRKVMVVADSCYSGALTRSSLTNVDTGKEVEEQINLLRKMAKDKTRVVLSSGGLKPVLDGGGGKHSVFAKHFISVLEENQEILVGRVLHLRLSAKVAYDADKYRFEQVPDYAPIRFAGHDGGDFLFVPATN